MQRDIKNVPPRPLEPGGHPAELVVLLEQQHRTALPGQNVGGGQPRKARANHHHIVVFLGVFEKILRHGSDFTPNSRGLIVRGVRDKVIALVRSRT